MAKLLVSDEARKEFANLRRAFDDVNQQLQTKFSQEPQPIDWDFYRKGIGSKLVDMYKEAYENACTSKLHGPVVAPQKLFASITMGEEKPFDFLRTLFEGVIAGGTAGVVVETVLYPIDTIKTRLQAARGGSKIEWKGLYSGLAGNIAGVLPASAVFVGIYEPTKQKLLEIFPEKFSAVAHLTAGAIGGAAASLIRVPTEVVKQRMQTGQFSSAPDAVRLILAKEGFKGLYAGYSSLLLRDLPFDAIQFCLYEQLRIGYKIAAKRELNDPENAVIGAVAEYFCTKRILLLKELLIEFGTYIPCYDPQFGKDNSILEMGASPWRKERTGPFAGAITGAITAPLDVMKTRLMVQGQANQYNGLLSCAQTILREEGPAAFLKGIGPRVLWIGIGGSIFFGVLERTKLLLSQRHSKRSISESSKEE